jgi:hypothetical protein
MAVVLCGNGRYSGARSFGCVFLFLFRDPNRLQSENYQLERFRLEMIGDDMIGGATAALLLEQPQVPNFLPNGDGGGR